MRQFQWKPAKTTAFIINRFPHVFWFTNMATLFREEFAANGYWLLLAGFGYAELDLPVVYNLGVCFEMSQKVAPTAFYMFALSHSQQNAKLHR